MVASDRCLGGFGHTWGEDQPNVQRKKRLLEAEGIAFEEDGKICKIREDFFVQVEPASNNQDARPKSKTNEKGSKKRKLQEDGPKAASTKTKSKYFDTKTSSVSEETLKQEILNLLGKRDVGKTC